MADESIQEAQASDEPQGEPKSTTDWKAEARKWENLAKKGKAAEEELAKLKSEGNARAEKAEAELAAIKAENEHRDAAKEFSEKNGVPVELLEFIPTDRMEDFCKAFKAKQVPVPSVAPAFTTRIVQEGGRPNPQDAFIEFAERQLKH